MSKYYLNGIDWVTQALNRQCLKTPARGNSFIIAIELEGLVSKDEIEDLLKKADPVLAILNGKTVRQKVHLAPYWKPRNNKQKIRVEHIHEEEIKSFEQQIEEISNLPFRDKNEHLAVFIINKQNDSVLLFKFDHRLFDGGGGELFLNELTKERADFEDPDCISPQLSTWKDKFDSGKTVNRTLIAATDSRKRKFFCFHKKPSLATNRFKILHIDSQKAERFFMEGEKRLGAFMNTPFLMTSVFNVLAQTAFRHGCHEDTCILLPMTVDLRSTGSKKHRIFFNQWSMAPFVLPLSTALDTDKSMEELKKQFFELIKSNFLHDLDKANLLTRIVPLPLFSRVSSNIFNGTNGSCSFAFLSEPGMKSKTFAEKNIKNLFHLPLIPPKPGIGIFINDYNGSLNIVFSWRDDIISEQELSFMFKTLEESFNI